jgi:hypothetical protein
MADPVLKSVELISRLSGIRFPVGFAVGESRFPADFTAGLRITCAS